MRRPRLSESWAIQQEVVTVLVFLSALTGDAIVSGLWVRRGLAGSNPKNDPRLSEDQAPQVFRGAKGR